MDFISRHAWFKTSQLCRQRWILSPWGSPKYFKKCWWERPLPKMLQSIPCFSSSQMHTKVFQLMDSNKNRRIKRCPRNKPQQCAFCHPTLGSFFCLALLQLGLTKTTLWWKGLGMPPAALNLRVSTRSCTERARESKRVRAGLYTSHFFFPHCLSCTSQLALGLAGGSGGGGHRTGLWTGHRTDKKAHVISAWGGTADERGTWRLPCPSG